MAIRRMCWACWIHKFTNTHSEYVMLIAFSLQPCLQECASMLYLYVHCLVCWCTARIILKGFVVLNNIRVCVMDSIKDVRRGSCNHCCIGKVISVTYCVCVCGRVREALVIQYAVRMRHIVIYGMSGSTVFYHIIS
jgi:hypothetical protein